MTIKVAIIGTSHVGALVSSWRKIGDEFPSIEPTFFAAPGKLFRRFTINTAKRFGILDRSLFTPHDIHIMQNTFDALNIQLQPFDAVIHVGHLIQETELVELVTSFSIDGVHEDKTLPMLSREAYDSFAQALAEDVVLPENWQDWSDPRLYVLPTPRLAETCAESDSVDFVAWRQLLTSTDPKAVASLLDDYTNRLVDSFSRYGIHMFTPPAQVLAENGLSKAEFNQGTVRLKDGESYPGDDHRHMNEEYGLIVLRHVLEVLKKDFWAPSAPKPDTNVPAEPTIVFKRRDPATSP